VGCESDCAGCEPDCESDCYTRVDFRIYYRILQVSDELLVSSGYDERSLRALLLPSMLGLDSIALTGWLARLKFDRAGWLAGLLGLERKRSGWLDC
jgi:hypothetical protein